MNLSPATFPVLLRGTAVALMAASALLTVSCTTFNQPPPPPSAPGFAPPGQARYGYGGTQSPNYSEPRALPANPGQREIKRDPQDTNVNIEPPPPRNTGGTTPPAAEAGPAAEAPPTTSAPATETPPAVTKPVPREDLPYGIPVVGKKGYVYSPYAEDKGLVDVEGMKRGTRVECPYTKKHFRVP